MSFTRPPGTMRPWATATVSMCPNHDHAAARQKSEQMSAAAVRPSGEAVSSTSSAAGRNSRSSRVRSTGERRRSSASAPRHTASARLTASTPPVRPLVCLLCAYPLCIRYNRA